MSDLTDAPPQDLPPSSKNLLVVAGPCSAESQEQILDTAKALQGMPISYFRAGLWKPRTRPGAFEGVGTKGIAWLQEVKRKTKLKIITEVSLPHHVEETLKAGFDALWIGARTVSDPFAVQNLADALKGCTIPIFVKNPISPDINLWIGAIERLSRANVQHLGAIFRGFSPMYSSKLGYRNTPSWSVAFELKRIMPHLPIICDPSHITGKRSDVEEFCKKSVELGFDGVMIETHIQPDEAKSDASQQVSPTMLRKILQTAWRSRRTTQPYSLELETYRKLLSEIDDALLSTLAKRIEVAREIGRYKDSHEIPILQMEHFSNVLKTNLERAKKLELPTDFVYLLFTEIHELSTKVQFEEAKKAENSILDKERNF